jgi:hypothetical protein
VFSVTPRPCFTPGKGSTVPTVQEVGWAPEPVWTQKLEKKSLASAGDQISMARVVQSVARRCTRQCMSVSLLSLNEVVKKRTFPHTPSNTGCQRSSSEVIVNNTPHPSTAFKETEWLKESATGPCPGPDKFTPHPHSFLNSFSG